MMMVKVSIVLAAASSVFVLGISYQQSLHLHNLYSYQDAYNIDTDEYDDGAKRSRGHHLRDNDDDNDDKDDDGTRLNLLRFERSKQQLQVQRPTKTEPRKSSSSSRRRTRAVIHMGPHKTGSTTIQDQTKVWSKQLLMDRYEMPFTNLLLPTVNDDQKDEVAVGKKHNTTRGINTTTTNETAPVWTKRNFKWNNPNHQYNFAMCFMTKKIPSSSDPNNVDPAGKCIPQLLLEGSNIASRHNNLLVSAEEFDLIQDHHDDDDDGGGIRMLKPYLSQWDDVSLVVYHRRLYDRIISSHNQINKRKTYPIRLEHLRPMIKFIEQHHLNPTSVGYAKQTVPLLQRLSKHFDKDTQIVVRNFHDDGQDGKLAERFFCDAIPDAKHTCAAIRRSSVRDRASDRYSDERQDPDQQENATILPPLRDPPRSNTKSDSSSLDYRFIAGGALKSGLIVLNDTLDGGGGGGSSGSHRKEQERLVDAVQNHHENVLKLTTYDFPRICPSRDLLEKLWNATLTYEIWMLENYFLDDDKKKKKKRKRKMKFHFDDGDGGEDDADDADDADDDDGDDDDDDDDDKYSYYVHQYKTWLRTDFELASRTSLCELDVQAVLEQEQWITFFQQTLSI